MAQKQDGWQYRIEPYRRIPGEEGWSPAPENQAEVWFGFRDKGDDRRCFGVFPTRSNAEKAMAMLKETDQQPARDNQRSQGYHASQRRNGTEDEIIIHAPDGRHMAYIQFWDEGWDGPGAGHKEAKADAIRILAALNAYQPEKGTVTETKAYDAQLFRDLADGEAVINIRESSSRVMAFLMLPEDDASREADLVEGDARLIVDALNAYQHSREGRSGLEDLRKLANESKQGEKPRTNDHDRER